jgi:N-acetylglutamate synthase-like GNAT family acetyltransferase
VEIRDAKLEDLISMTDLIMKASERFILPKLNDEGKTTYLQSHSLELMKERLESFQYQVLEKNSKIIGVVGVRRPSHLFHLHLDPDFHGQGYGTSLWKAAKDRAMQLDQPAIFTVNSSVYAVSFYRKLGFVGDDVKVVGGVEFVPMALDLARTSSR